ncbi:peptidase-S24 family protein [Blastocystis sp. subtype 4]|uniref:peptidase-S24 family protein n=1 Tax=Blastocystis sp. subtype 4 TaxID=944170 RepID=UPI000711AAF3|nr:peptidase-S24 family protein [Blastocystis sp. subtype 4]KNB43049.1 peptidase-S24 family protein [Blastocystis sp. subtype 4]|eukprot:XP_014526492.1 peptidase-S24 family protein [Blastocystis sp. subtype 4]
MKWLRPTIVKLNNLRAFPSLYRGYADTRILARNIPRPSAETVFPGDLVVCLNPWEEGKLLVRRVKQITQIGDSIDAAVAWVSSETVNGGIDSKVFGPIPVQSILARACYFYNDKQNHGPIQNNEQSLPFDRVYISHGEHFFQ